MSGETRITPEMSVADIVAAHPEIKSTLRTLGIDLCCGGSLSLREAAEIAGTDVKSIIDRLASASAPDSGPVRAEDSVRMVIAKFPLTIAVFEQHGLMGCGGAAGPDERIDFFANVHRIDMRTLLGEINAAAAIPASVPSPQNRAVPETVPIFRPFLLAALALTVVLGAALGAHNLLALHAGAMPFRPALNGVHGAAQVWGFVFLFIVGVAYHAFPRFLGTELRCRRLARASLWLAVLGLALAIVSRVTTRPDAATILSLLGALATFAAVVAFAIVLVATWRTSSGPPDLILRFLATGTFWWVVAAALLLAQAGRDIALGTTAASDASEAIYASALYGGTLLWISGMFLRIGPVFLNLAPTRTGLVRATLGTTNVGVLLAVGGLSAPTIGASATAANAGLLTIALSVILFIVAVRPWSGDARQFADGNPVFVRVIHLAFAAAVLFAILAGAAATSSLLGAHPSRLLTDGARHAFGLGFVALMIFGVAARIVPIICGTPLAFPRALALGTNLIAIGVVLREAQVLVALFGEPALLKVSALSGIPSALGVFLASVSLFATLLSRESKTSVLSSARTPIAHDSNVAALIASHSEALPILIEAGFTPLANPILRRTLARAVSLRQACRMHKIDVDAVVARIKAACQHIDAVRPAQSAAGAPLVSLKIKAAERR